MRILLALLLVLVVAGPAQAILVGGTISTSTFTDFTPVFNLHSIEGEGLFLGGGDLSGLPFPSPVTGIKSLNAPVDLSHTFMVESRLFVATGPGASLQTATREVVTGALTFDVEPFLLTPFSPIPTAHFAIGESTFTMAGAVSFGGQTVNLEGFGTVFYDGDLVGPLLTEVEPVFIGFELVPEPATLTLLGTAAGLGALYGGLRKRRGDR